MARIKNIVFILLLIFLFVEILIIFPRHLESIEQDPPTSEAIKENSGAEQTMTGVHLVESLKGSRDWELFAKAAEGYQGKASWDLEEVKVQFYNQDKIDFIVIGKLGNIENRTKNMTIRGKVRISSANGYVFESDQVYYDAKQRKIASPGPIFMKGPHDEQGEGLEVRGSEMSVNVEKSEMIVRGEVHAAKKLIAAKNFGLTSDSAELSGRSREIKFLGQVIINYNTTKIEGPQAHFFYSKTKETLRNITLAGGVRVSDEDKYALSEEMSLDLEENKFTFRGQPRLFQNKDELSGEQIVFLDGGKKVKVENIKARVENKPSDKIRP